MRDRRSPKRQRRTPSDGAPRPPNSWAHCTIVSAISEMEWSFHIAWCQSRDENGEQGSVSHAKRPLASHRCASYRLKGSSSSSVLLVLVDE
jgi:hypothetical protein